MDRLAEKLDARLREWKPETAAVARERILEVIAPIMISSMWRARARSNRRSSTCSMSPQPGEIWLAVLGLAAKTRPVVIVSERRAGFCARSSKAFRMIRVWSCTPKDNALYSYRSASIGLICDAFIAG